MRQDERDNLELDKPLIEKQRLSAETRKFVAEISKLRRETFCYPFIVGSTVLAALSGIISLVTK
ncbi:hypothetical protein [Pseudomonas sp. NPDC089401]|uniref:hypothetical protein n=1 Tax=Pseudomonas sp. NPDC089401 TaxID=3364462 RepID=UPI00382A8D5B